MNMLAGEHSLTKVHIDEVEELTVAAIRSLFGQLRTAIRNLNEDEQYEVLPNVDMNEISLVFEPNPDGKLTHVSASSSFSITYQLNGMGVTTKPPSTL